MKIRRLYFIIFSLLGILSFCPMSAEAGTIYNSPYVSFSPDGNAWTTDAGNRNVEQYLSDGSDDVETGISSALRALKPGEHYYDTVRQGTIPVGKWRVVLSGVNCCHYAVDHNGGNYHGISYATQNCLKPYFSGWAPICADCGRIMFYGNIYMSKKTAESLTYLDLRDGLDYYYLCPFNSNLEQGMHTEKHICSAISANRYRVEYLPNAGGSVHGGYMLPSYHIYNNASVYEGSAVTPQTRLNQNNYSRIGWKFIGWNTRADGGGDTYADGAEIYNLCAGDYLQTPDAGTVKLYAMWERVSSVLEVDAAGGYYENRPGITSLKMDYGSVYAPAGSSVVPPAGHRVSFNTGGGYPIPDLTGTMRFAEWKQEGIFRGNWKNEKYTFSAPDGNIDRITAVYVHNAVKLPEPYKDNASFGGWYYNSSFTMPAGKAGEYIVPEKDLVLYAHWVELVLRAEDNYAANGGSGAVNLSWQQDDGQNKVYKIYQSRNGELWDQINSATDISNNTALTKKFCYCGQSERYTIPSSGFYQLAAYGAQGQSYGDYQGGKGGEVNARIWLDKGEVLEVTVGGTDGYNGGGKGNQYAGGGGCTQISSRSRGCLVVAGGGGGAAPNGNGYAGGSVQSLVSTGMEGENGASGGGGGYRGGRSGTLIVHNHVEGVCSHRHEGSPDRYGGCYTAEVLCGEALEHTHTKTENWKWAGLDTIFCPSCGANAEKGEDCVGHTTEYYKHVCIIHGYILENTLESSPQNCSELVSYGLTCGLTEEYTCGYPYDGYVINSKSAYGGSSYVNSALAASYKEEAGKKIGNGEVLLTSESIGYCEELKLDAVTAADRAAPDAVRADTVKRTGVGADHVLLEWERPQDRGTVYYHKAESYLTGSTTVQCTSNITANTLVSGIKGYYYCVSDIGNTVPNAENGIFTAAEQVLQQLPECGGYFHVRAVDSAGNWSGTTHIPLGSRVQGDKNVAWPLFTNQLMLEEGENVYAVPSEKTYYVRGDGRTPFCLNYAAYMQGSAVDSYQLNYAVFRTVDSDGGQGKNIIGVPSGKISDAELRLEAADLTYAGEGRCCLQYNNYTIAVRSNRGRRLTVSQKFLTEKSDSGRTMEVIPAAGADFGQEIVWSDDAADKANSLRIIVDGEPPVVKGMESLEKLVLIDRRCGDVELCLDAADALCGLRELKLIVHNLDNDARQEWSCGSMGNLRVNITADQPIFSGDFDLEIYACDNVGNETTFSYSTTEFDLQAEVMRILEPHTPIFKRGESGVLHITAWGYAERIEIEFPPELSASGEELNYTYEYDMKQHYRQEEDYTFMIPLYAPENARYNITIRAYKGNKCLELYPAFSIIGVEGTVLDEIRTRLR